MTKANHERTFTELLSELVQVEREFQSISTGSNRKLSAKAWMKAVAAIALTSPKRLDEIDALAAKADNAALARFITALMREVVLAATYPIPPASPLRLVRVYGAEDTLDALNALGVGPLEALAAASRTATTRFPERFGTLDEPMDQAAYAKRDMDLQNKRRDLRLALPNAPDFGLHVVLETGYCNGDERARGLLRARLRDWPRVVMCEDWVQHLVAHIIAAEDAGKTKTSAAA